MGNACKRAARGTGANAHAVITQRRAGLMRPCLEKYLLTLMFLIAATPASAEENWVLVGGPPSGTNGMRIYIDLNSYKLLPNGVTTYKDRWQFISPLSGKPMNIDSANGIDCKTRQIVNPSSGIRAAINPQDLDAAAAPPCPGDKCSPVGVAFRSFCPSK